MVWVPVVALLPTLILIVEDPEPGAAIGLGLKVTVTRDGMLLATG
jgi:hypothetical protein